MAQVDFSNAKLEPTPVQPDKHPMNYSYYMNLNTSTGFFVWVGSTPTLVTSSMTRSIFSDTPSKVSILYTGIFSTSGTEFYIGDDLTWRVSNISYSAGDTFSFIIDIETSGNT